MQKIDRTINHKLLDFTFKVNLGTTTRQFWMILTWLINTKIGLVRQDSLSQNVWKKIFLHKNLFSQIRETRHTTQIINNFVLFNTNSSTKSARHVRILFKRNPKFYQRFFVYMEICCGNQKKLFITPDLLIFEDSKITNTNLGSKLVLYIRPKNLKKVLFWANQRQI